MALCEQCGSIQVVRAVPESTDKFASFFNSKRPFICRRCGWRGRREWTDQDLIDLYDYGAGGAEVDPSLAVLDGDQDPQERAGASKAEFDLAAINLSDTKPFEPHGARTPDGTPHRTAAHGRPRTRKLPSRSRRREIVLSIAATALVMLVVAILGLTGSCGGGAGAF